MLPLKIFWISSWIGYPSANEWRCGWVATYLQWNEKLTDRGGSTWVPSKPHKGNVGPFPWKRIPICSCNLKNSRPSRASTQRFGNKKFKVMIKTVLDTDPVKAMILSAISQFSECRGCNARMFIHFNSTRFSGRKRYVTLWTAWKELWFTVASMLAFRQACQSRSEDHGWQNRYKRKVVSLGIYCGRLSWNDPCPHIRCIQRPLSDM